MPASVMDVPKIESRDVTLHEVISHDVTSRDLLNKPSEPELKAQTLTEKPQPLVETPK